MLDTTASHVHDARAGHRSVATKVAVTDCTIPPKATSLHAEPLQAEAFGIETLRLRVLSSLGPATDPPWPRGCPWGRADKAVARSPAKGEAGIDLARGVRLETLNSGFKHPTGVVGITWSPTAIAIGGLR